MMSAIQAVLALFAKQNFVTFPHEQEGKISDVIETGKVWRVSYGASYWFARSYKCINLSPGDRVRIIERQGIVLFIEPLEEEE